MVRSDVHRSENRGNLVLSRRNFIVLSLGRNTKFPQFNVQLMHKRRDTLMQRTKIMVIHLLATRRGSTQQRTAGQHKVQTFFYKTAVNQKIFLLTALSRSNTIAARIAQKTQNPHRLFVQRVHRTQQRSLLIQCVFGVRTERTGNIKRNILAVFFDKRRRSYIPRRITTGLKSRPQTTAGKR